MTYTPFKNNYIQVELSTDTASVSDNGGNRCPFDIISFKGTGHLSMSSGKVGLLAGRIYEVSASSRVVSTGAMQIYDFTNGVGLSVYANITAAVNSDGHTECIVAPTENIEVGVSAATAETFESSSSVGPSMLVVEL